MPQATPRIRSTVVDFERAARPPRRHRSRQRRMATMTRARRRLLGGVLIACLGFAAIAAWERFTEPQGESRTGPVALCSLLQRRTCLIDGDTGRDNGEKWRLISIDTPELSEPACDNERRLAVAARDRLRALLGAGYRIRASGRYDPHGRALVDIELADGRDVSRILLTEGLAQKWPNRGNIWCDRYTGSPSRPRG
jgi:endonuclease YncB( thermonuclease family)